LPRWRDGEWPEQCGVDTTSKHTAFRENRVSDNPHVNRPDERYCGYRIVQKVSHNGKQIFVRECFRIE
jgi:hypothetical protein